MKQGYENTSMQDIVNHLGMSKGTIYHHFKSKEDLLEKISFQYFANIDWFYSLAEDKRLSGLERLRKIPVEQVHCSVNEVVPCCVSCALPPCSVCSPRR